MPATVEGSVMHRSLLLPILLVPGSAMAAQGASASAYAGTYDLSCASAALSIDVGVTVGIVGQPSQSWSERFVWPLACQVPEAELAADVQDVEDACVAALLPAADCARVADDLYAALLPFTDLDAHVLPNELRLNVESWNWWGKLTGVYPAYGWHTWADGTTQGWGYLLDNNLGANEGHLWAAGFGLTGAQGADGIGCATTAAAVVDGRILRTSGYALDLGFGIDQRLFCLAGNEGGALAVTFGIDFEGRLTGVKVP